MYIELNLRVFDGRGHFRLYLPHLDEVLGIKISENVILKGNMLGFLSLLKLTIYIINF